MLNKEIFISIVVPVYNTEQYLDECLQSILKQTIIENIELICVNDGSSDAGLQRIQEIYFHWTHKVSLLYPKFIYIFFNR